jgi:hypothetical protein
LRVHLLGAGLGLGVSDVVGQLSGDCAGFDDDLAYIGLELLAQRF